jgi:hypothetical protein
MPIVRDPLDPKISMWHFLAHSMRFFREGAGLSLTQCGRIIGVQRSTVSNFDCDTMSHMRSELAGMENRHCRVRCSG